MECHELYPISTVIAVGAIAVALTNLAWTLMMQVIIHKLKEQLRGEDGKQRSGSD